ncbi:hypothetical protein IQ254_08540 [Nodosilinea sp. LEGE 07088]|uniref:hypothetical protein n=1 Tax=Nodosilinea sp. LEGE 07088 TaxID=2777968 RepID=UPI001881B469|nr:hypothetical protein [Nodosilinea sp. LEGE 07088]MBE9137253.1 hypothetical protein [Nodosilinea sp. LEGE 07088]
MELFKRQVWINFLGLLPGSLVTVLVIAIAFLRFYDKQDFQFLSIVAQPQLWSNRLTVAALLAALANFGVEWNRRNREGNREAEARDRRAEETEREAERAEREARRDRQEVRYQKAQIRYQLDPNVANRQELILVLAALEEYEQTLSDTLSA